jgi:hypothetical protein
MTSATRSPPLILVGTSQPGTADEIVARLRRDGVVAYASRSPEGCLRVATSVGPDVVLLDPAWPPRLESMLRSHPTSARSRVLHLSGDSRLNVAQAARLLRPLPAA